VYERGVYVFYLYFYLYLYLKKEIFVKNDILISVFGIESSSQMLKGDAAPRHQRLPVTVSKVHEVHASAGWPKQGLRVLASMPSVGEIVSEDLCGCRFVKGKIGSADY